MTKAKKESVVKTAAPKVKKEAVKAVEPKVEVVETVAEPVVEAEPKVEVVETVAEPVVEVAVASPTVGIFPTVVSCFKNQSVRLFASASADMLPPLKYQWKKSDTNIDGATSPVYVVQPNATATYKCEVTDSTARAAQTATGQVVVTVEGNENPEPPMFKVKRNEFHDRGFTSMNGAFIESLNRAIAQINPSNTSGEAKNLGDYLVKKITQDRTGTGKAGLCSTLLTALGDCGKVVVQDTKNGYFHTYSLDDNKNKPQISTGRMVNFWPKPTE